MRFKLKMPDMVREAGKTGGKNLVLEILIFVAVFWLSQSITVVPITIGVIVMLVTDPAFMDAVLYGNVRKVERITAALAESNGMTLMTLFTTGILILVVILFCRWIQKRKIWTLGFKKPGMWKEYGIGAAVGFGMMAVLAAICAITGAANFSRNPRALTGAGLGMLLLMLAGFMIQGMSEEVLCRGYFLVSLARKKGDLWLAVIANSVAFGLLHLLNPGLTVLSMVNLILFGIFASVYFVKRGSIWGIAAIHTVWNFAQGNLFGFLVSGQGFGVSLLTAELEDGMTLLTGGSFGLEGGLLVTVLLVIATVVMLGTEQKDVAAEEPEAPAEVPVEVPTEI